MPFLPYEDGIFLGHYSSSQKGCNKKNKKNGIFEGIIYFYKREGGMFLILFNKLTIYNSFVIK